MNGLSMERMAVVRQKSTGKYLAMPNLDPDTKESVYGPLEKSWIASSFDQAEAQAALLGADHEAVRL
jgi:hypothetical protein